MANSSHSPARPRFGKVLARASTSPINIGVGAAAATLAIGLGSLPLAALGALAYGAMVAFDTFNPTFWKKVYALPAGPPVRLPNANKVHDRGTRAAVEMFHAAKAELDRALADTPADVIAQLATALASLDELEAHAARLVVRAEDISRYLATLDIAAVKTEMSVLEARLRQTPDPDARKTFTDARNTRADELRTINELIATKDRIDASLSHLVAMLGGLPTKVVHMRALDGQSADQLSGDLDAELEAVGVELRTSEEVMKSLGELR